VIAIIFYIHRMVRINQRLGYSKVARPATVLLKGETTTSCRCEHVCTFDPFLKEIEELRLAFQEFSFSYVSRKCNKVAHILARQVSYSHRSEMWHVTPTCVYDLIVSEASTG